MASIVAELLRDFNAVMAAAGCRFYLFGAQAAILHGAARTTADVDVTVDLQGTETAALLGYLEKGGFSIRVENPLAFAARTQVVPVVHLTTRLPVDVVLAASPLEDEFMARAKPFVVEGVSFPVATAEDLVVMKVLAGRGKDLDDARSILAAQMESIEMGRIEALLGALEAALDRADLLPALQRLRPPKRE